MPAPNESSKSKENMIKQEFSPVSWTNREISWYETENRFLFKPNSNADCIKWIRAFKKALAHRMHLEQKNIIYS
jgi:hypothetical protein